MEIIIGENAGFCYIAQKAIDKILEETKQGTVYCLGEVVHNKNVIDCLKNAGVNFINKIEESKGNTIIGPHGVTKDIYEKAKNTNMNIMDLTCPVVLKIKRKVEDYFKNGFFIVIIGKPNHAEVLGVKSIAGDECDSIEDKSEIQKLLKTINNKKRILLISQTTYSSKKFDEIAEEFKKHIKCDAVLEINKTICSTTENRQKETRIMAQSVDTMIIVGDKNSSNTNELYNIACKYCKKTQFICSKEELNLSHIKENSKIGIMAGASTPKEDILKVKNTLLASKN